MDVMAVMLALKSVASTPSLAVEFRPAPEHTAGRIGEA
jgi:hypothetical protein